MVNTSKYKKRVGRPVLMPFMHREIDSGVKSCKKKRELPENKIDLSEVIIIIFDN